LIRNGRTGGSNRRENAPPSLSEIRVSSLRRRRRKPRRWSQHHPRRFNSRRQGPHRADRVRLLLPALSSIQIRRGIETASHRRAPARGRREHGATQEPRGVGAVQGVRSKRRRREAKRSVFEIGGVREREGDVARENRGVGRETEEEDARN